jgi:hypothetical protein
MSFVSFVHGWRFRLVTLFALCGVWRLALPAEAAGIRYQLTVPSATVHIGSQDYTNAQVTFTFIGDDANVVSGTLPGGLTYSAIYKGCASVTVVGPAPVLVSAVFTPNQIVVSVDHRHEGVGFGFVPGGIGASGFDVTQLQPIYPGGISDTAVLPGQTPSGWIGYDLTLAYAQSHTNYYGGEFHADGSVDIFAAVYSCNQFSGSVYYMSCASPAWIQIENLGTFSIDAIFEPTWTGVGPVDIGEFTAMAASPCVPSGVPSSPSNLSVTPQ